MKSERWAYVNQVRLIPHVQVMHDRSFIQVSQLSHVVGLVEFRWIDLVNAFEIDVSLLDQIISATKPIEGRKPSHCHRRIARLCGSLPDSRQSNPSQMLPGDLATRHNACQKNRFPLRYLQHDLLRPVALAF